MKREICRTADGSHSFKLPGLNEQYHSKHGAVQEARHVFIKKGLAYVYQNINSDQISVLEMGFGTGLNALLTAQFAEEYKINVKYTGIEAYPITKKEWNTLNYPEYLQNFNAEKTFQNIQQAEWEKQGAVSEHFNLKKQKQFFEDFEEINCADLIYFDAFGARVQPDLWSKAIFLAMHHALRKNGCLVTYSAKGSVRRTMQAIGFEVEKLEGPPGKREMMRAVKV